MLANEPNQAQPLDKYSKNLIIFHDEINNVKSERKRKANVNISKPAVK